MTLVDGEMPGLIGAIVPFKLSWQKSLGLGAC
jgi:hypothetical protein